VSVRDSGIGIAAADEQRVFEKFGQVGNILTDKPQGTGLGLPISGSIAVQHGGALWVESTPGVGSVFSVSIPMPAGLARARSTGAAGAGRGPARGRGAAPARGVVPRATAPAALGAVALADPVIGRARDGAKPGVLVVDDEPSIVAAVTELL